mmetsp:Transcript_4761/g.8391  ORF Transcript_4761/g.8391 Transcript_4761/m.8391 type:complete len:184 (-) Transcript_4761:75-626(-)
MSSSAAMNFIYSILAVVLVTIPMATCFSSSPNGAGSLMTFHHPPPSTGITGADGVAPMMSFMSNRVIFQPMKALKPNRFALAMILRCTEDEDKDTNTPTFKYVIDGDDYSSFYDYITKKELPFQCKETSSGHFVQCIDSICADDDDKIDYWKLFKNGIKSGVGIDDLDIKKGDVVKFVLTYEK